ncbi:hypothetical protein AB0B45_30515 [Nonomuraea sp. NPDC049152]|uniref:hypothetical protein n=1 Tax=Nonomuraea sp. NPDC049152 TaxID=3154350 RepID=UPI0033EC8939
MLKKLALSGAVLAAFAGVGLATPAQADTWPKPSDAAQNVSTQNGNTAVCGNQGIGDVTAVVLNFTPVVIRDNKAVTCQVIATQD